MVREVIQGDCLEIMRLFVKEGIKVSSIVTDPPYNLSFMGMKWDNAIACNPEVWRLCLELLHPGGYLVAFGGTRTYHRMACAVEDAGFEIREQLAWMFSQGFPKSMNIAKAIDKAARGVPQGGHDPTSVNHGKGGRGRGAGPGQFMHEQGEPTERELVAEAQPWIGYGTALKPAWEPILLARKPLSEKTVAANVLRYGTGGLNIDATRVPINPEIDDPRLGGKGTWGTSKMAKNVYEGGYEGIRVTSSPIGRFPANLVHDGSGEVLELFAQYGERGGGDKRGDCKGRRPSGFGNVGNDSGESEPNATVYADKGTVARFFYQAKASKTERRDTKHPTVKPLAVMRWLVKMVTPPNGIVLDPFAGSGTTGEAAQIEGFEFIMIEKEAEYVEDIKKRIGM